MNGTIIYICIFLCVISICFALYQSLVSKRVLKSKIRQISEKLFEILQCNSDESVMVFTDDKALKELAMSINKLLQDRRITKANYRKQALSSKKMLSNISHDIKTPLTVILGYLEIMQLEDKNDEMLVKVEQKAKQVMELINQFFTLSKIEAGDMEIQLSKLNVNEICRANILDFYQIVTLKNFTVEIDIPETPVFVQADEDALNRILFNLLSNAVRYGSDGQYLGLFLREEDTYIYVDIVDKGKGIDKVFAENVFERLFTMDDSRNREIQGNGLGLTIAKNLAVQMGGDILLVSEPTVKTVFSVKLVRVSKQQA